MITTAILLVAFTTGQDQAPQQPAPQQAAPLIRNMIERYAKAQTLTGTIRLTQVAGRQGGTLLTNVQYEKPSKLFIKQALSTASGQTWLVTSDGKHFSYNKPKDAAGDPRIRLVEPIQPNKYERFDIRSIYGIVAQTLGDREAPLSLAIGRTEDVTVFTAQLAEFKYEGKVKLGEEEVHFIRGTWRENAALRPKGFFELHITDAGDMRRYAIRETIAPSPTSGAIEITSTWDVNLVVDGKPDQGLFKLVR